MLKKLVWISESETNGGQSDRESKQASKQDTEKSHLARPNIAQDLLKFFYRFSPSKRVLNKNNDFYYLKLDPNLSGWKNCEFISRNIALRGITNDYDLQPLTARRTLQTRFPTLFEVMQLGE